MANSRIGRRELIRRGLAMAGVLTLGKTIFAPAVAFAEAAAAKKTVFKLIDEQKNVTAKSLKFTHDGAKNPARKQEKSICGNCQMYRKKGEVDGVEVGTCNMIGGGYVKVGGWCTSWVKDPKTFK